MLTAMTAFKDKMEGYDAGADDYIVKPLSSGSSY
jgi:DNA-binding response OmpR family regulator